MYLYIHSFIYSVLLSTDKLTQYIKKSHNIDSFEKKNTTLWHKQKIHCLMTHLHWLLPYGCIHHPTAASSDYPTGVPSSNRRKLKWWRWRKGFQHHPFSLMMRFIPIMSPHPFTCTLPSYQSSIHWFPWIHKKNTLMSTWQKTQNDD